METTKSRSHRGEMLTVLVLAMGLILTWPGLSMAAPMGTAFTYQGHLYDANYVANGLYDFTFKLYDAEVAGGKIGTDVYIADVDVIDAYFTVELDFNDVDAFNGDARWLEIGVRPGEQSDPCEYTVLNPRQEVTPTPYALYAKTAGSGGVDSDWEVSGNDMYSIPSGNVGIGTTSPGKKLDVAGGINATDYYYLNDNVLVYNTPGTGDFLYGWDVAVQKHSMATNGVERLVIDSAGNVGIGTTTPSAKLDVLGTLEVISSDTLSVSASNSNTSGNAVYGQATGSSGCGVQGWSNDTGNVMNVGGMFQAEGGEGRGVYGAANNTADSINFGGYFRASGGQGRGVAGSCTGTNGVGVYGSASGSNGIGVIGSTSGGTSSKGVYGWASSTTGTNIGVHGKTSSNDGYAGYFEGGRNYFQGNVGIGTAAAAAPLEVNFDNDFTTKPAIVINNNTGNQDVLEFRFSDVPNARIRKANAGDLYINGLQNRINLTTGGDNRLSVHPNGNVGVGVLDPSTKLEVDGQVKITGGSPGLGKVLTSDDNGLASWETPTGGADSDWAVVGSDMYGIPGGNVGIGTTIPSAKLDVRGTVNVGQNNSGYDVSFYGAYNGGRLFWNQSKMALRAGIEADSEWDDTAVGFYSLGVGSSVAVSGNRSYGLGEEINVTGHYSAAIGSGLDVTGNYSTAIGKYLDSGPAGSAFVIGTGVNNSVRLTNTTANSLAIGFNSSIPTFFVGPGSGGTTTGDVGIGTASPDEKLTVAGTVKSTTTLPGGRAVAGYAVDANDVTNYGGYFEAAGTYGRGVFGKATGENGYGVYGEATGDGVNYGGYFKTNSDTGYGIYCFADGNGTSTNYGGYFRAAGQYGRGVYSVTSGQNSYAFYGRANNSDDVTNYGGYFRALGRYGHGVHGDASGTDGIGVYGEASGGGRAGYFNGSVETAGDLHVTGDITKAFTTGTSSRAAPVAYATVNSNGTKASGTPNVTSAWNGTNQWYEITITGEPYFWSSFTTVVTVNGGTPCIATTDSTSNKLLVRLWNLSSNPIQANFQFVTYRP